MNLDEVDEHNIINSDNSKKRVIDFALLRQKSLDEFFCSGGVRKKPKYQAFLCQSNLNITLYKGIWPKSQFDYLLRSSLSKTQLLHKITEQYFPKNLKECNLIVDKLRFVDGREVHPKTGVNCIKFDNSGVLFAVGGSNGVIRVFDFDEVQHILYSNK